MGIIVKNGVEYGASVDLSSLQSAYTKAQVNAIIADVDVTPTESSHSEGDYFLVNGVLLKALRSISTEETLVIGNNVSETTVGDELALLKRSLDILTSRIDAMEAGGWHSGTGSSGLLSIDNDLLSASNANVSGDYFTITGFTVDSDGLLTNSGNQNASLSNGIINASNMSLENDILLVNNGSVVGDVVTI